MAEEKLQKALQAAGAGSRRNLRQDIHDGRIKVNNKVITDPNYLVDLSKDNLRIDDKKIKLKIDKISYYLFNKPYGVISSLSDPQGRPTITEFLTKIKERVYPVGRLDYHSEGLILLTNDGELTNFIISAKNKIPKVYMLKIKGVLSDDERKKLKTKGIHLDGTRVKPMSIDFVKKTAQNNSWIRVTIVEGKKHILRKVFKYSGHPVEKLRRVSIGSFRLKKLPAGHWREVTQEELDEFRKVYHYTDADTKPSKPKLKTKPRTKPKPKIKTNKDT